MKDFFYDMISGGEKASLMRFCILFVVVNAIAIAWYQQFCCEKIDWTQIITLISLALTGKISQKAIEGKQKPKE